MPKRPRAADNRHGIAHIFTGDTRRRAIRREGQGAGVTDQDDDRVGIAQGRTVGGAASLVIGAVTVAVGLNSLTHIGFRLGTHQRFGIEDQRPRLGAQEMIRAWRAQCRIGQIVIA